MMLIKNFVGVQLPFPLPISFLLVLLSLFPHLLPATAKESTGALKLVSESGRSPAATTFSEFRADRVLLMRTILLIITLYIRSLLGC